MGEVYRAHDTKLGRDVALKILPGEFTHDPDRLTRFKREAQVLASLNHPHIAAIYGLEESGGMTALVMELVEGDDLSQRIARGAMPLDEALPVAKQIAEALEAAHEQGIIHRDLKPANIKVRADGTVKVLDFGLAKAMEPPASSPNVSQSPTITTPAMTQAGVILGTAAYMSPEQAKGRPVDKRSDVWAFGCVLYEMLTGARAFQGDDVSDTLAAVLRGEPSWTALPTDTPPPIRRLLRRCLEKDRKRRLDSAAAARLEIEEALTTPSVAESAADAGTASPGLAPHSAWSRALPWMLATSTVVVSVALMSALLAWAPWRTTPVPAPRKLLASIGADVSLPTDLGASAILSPDGTTLAFVAQQAGQTRLFVRKLDQLQAAALAGTEGATSPFFSPDGQWVAFFAGGQVKKVEVTGGAAVPLCAAVFGRGGTWTDDDTIILTPTVVAGPLMRVSAAGGTPTAFDTPPGTGAATRRWPQALPGGKGVLYTEHSSAANFDGANLVVAPLAGGTPKVVVRGGYYGRYVPSGRASPTRAARDGGHLMYLRQSTLFAVRFDLDRLETIGPAMPALEDVATNPASSGGAQLAVSSEGTLVYVPCAAATAANSIDWMTREGKTSVLRATKADWANPRFSPDGQKLALEIFDGKHRNIWVYEWARDTLTQLTFDPGQDKAPVWTPDGRLIVFSSDRAKPGTLNLYWVNADGTGEVMRLTDSPEPQYAGSWHPSGKFLVFNGSPNANQMILPMEGDAARGWTPGKPTASLNTGNYSMFSPDGRWIAYASNEAGGGSLDVYVRPFPGPGGKWRISTDGGSFPHWSAPTHELLFVSQGKVMVARYVVVGDSFRADTPQVWSPTSVRSFGSNYPYDLHPDGKRLVIAAAPDQSNVVQDKVVFVSNFFDYLWKIAPGNK
jgi:serine/threonine-protein kinase